jgi:O-6-methylguanine DNA methyltransferase
MRDDVMRDDVRDGGTVNEHQRSIAMPTRLMSHESPPDFFERVWAVVARIPPGRVTTYGRIAEHLGTRSSSRAVGYALNAVARADADPLAVPCHRVVNRFGALTGRMHFDTPDAMEERLRAEGVAFTEDGCVDLDRHLWEPGPADDD